VPAPFSKLDAVAPFIARLLPEPHTATPDIVTTTAGHHSITPATDLPLTQDHGTWD
jgi:hypothetical protein